MKIILPGASIGLLGGGENTLMLALAAYRMGYRVHVYAAGDDPVGAFSQVLVRAPYEDLDRVRQFAGSVDVVTVSGSDVPFLCIQAAAGIAPVYPSPRTLEALENGFGAKREITNATPLAGFFIICARGRNNQCVFYPPVSMDLTDDVFDIAQMPAAIRAQVTARAAGVARDVLEELDFTGIACVGFVLTQEQELVVQEVTPQLHRAGYLTEDACVTSQFEQHLRAVCGLPPGSTGLLRPAAMANIPESAWEPGEPDWASALALPGVKLWLYGERRGHLAATAKSATLAKQIVRAARGALTPKL